MFQRTRRSIGDSQVNRLTAASPRRTGRALIVALIASLVVGLAALPARASSPEAPPQDIVVSLRTGVDVSAASAEILAELDHPDDAEVYESLGIIVATVAADEASAIASQSSVLAVEPDIMLSPALDESVPLIGASDAHSQGETGQGTAIAIIDTGVETSHRFIRGSVVHEACFTRNSCPNGTSSATGTGSATPCAVDGCSHGTHVAGIISGRDGARVGVAPDSQLIAIQVFSMINDPIECGSAAATPCARARTSDVLAALDHLHGIRNQFPLVAVNLSLSGDEALSSCNNLALKSGIDRLRGANIASIAASGNGRSSSGLGIPACISSTISVGATHATDDGRWALSNRSGLLDFWAPGVEIESSVPGGGYASASGTSAAAPHVAGVWALATTRLGTTNVDTVLAHLKSTAVALPGESQRSDLARRIDLRPLVTEPASVPASTHPAVTGDFDGDGRGDVLWYQPGGQADELWFGRSDRAFERTPLSVAGDFDPFVGDFDGDGRDDIFWNGPGTGGDWIWFGSANRTFTGKRSGVSDAFTPAVGDFDGDGRDDIFWNTTGNGDWIWYGAANRTFTGKRSAAGTGFSPTVGDFNGDGRHDIVWSSDVSGDWVWFGAPGRTFSGTRTSIGSGFTSTVGDFDGDGRDDIFWNAAGTGDWLWFGTSSRTFTAARTAAAGSYQVVSADFDGDRRDDILWNGAGASDFIWYGTSGRSFQPGGIAFR